LSGESSKLLLPITEHAKKSKIPVAVNPGSSQLVAGAKTLLEALKNIDVLILNSEEARLFMAALISANGQIETRASQTQHTQKKEVPLLLRTPIITAPVDINLSHFFKTVLERGPRMVVVTNGANGVYAASNDTIYYHPSVATKVVSSLGAGDAFGSCFVGSLAQGFSIEQSLRHGIINSASVLQFMNAKSGLLDLKELKIRESALDKNLLQKFPL
jgi:sugar/nucleoside kinase (ribokinase family)